MNTPTPRIGIVLTGGGARAAYQVGVLRAIADLAILPFRSNATRQDDGTWLLPIDDEVWQRVEDKRLPDESHDDTLTRIIREYRGLKPN